MRLGAVATNMFGLSGQAMLAVAHAIVVSAFHMLFRNEPYRELGALWTWMVEAGVEPTNTRAGRALRFAVLWRKLRPSTYNEKGERWVERILSLRETCLLRGIRTFPVLVDAVGCFFNSQHPDVSWI